MLITMVKDDAVTYPDGTYLEVLSGRSYDSLPDGEAERLIKEGSAVAVQIGDLSDSMVQVPAVEETKQVPPVEPAKPATAPVKPNPVEENKAVVPPENKDQTPPPVPNQPAG